MQVALSGAAMAGAVATCTSLGDGDINSLGKAGAVGPGASADHGGHARSEWRILAVRPRERPGDGGTSGSNANDVSAALAGDGGSSGQATGQPEGQQQEAGQGTLPGVQQRLPAAPQRAEQGSLNRPKRPGGLRASGVSAANAPRLGPPGRLRLVPKQAQPAAEQAENLAGEPGEARMQPGGIAGRSHSAGSVTGVRTGPPGTPAHGGGQAGAKAAATVKSVQRVPKVRPPPLPPLDTDVSTRKTFSFAHKGCAFQHLS